MSQYPEADRLVAEAAARGELPKITHENRAAFGLKFSQRHADGDGWRAWWQMDSKNGTSGITNPATRFFVATESLAPDGLPWPTHWSLDLFRSLSPGRELNILQFARRFDAESARCGFDLLSTIMGGKKPARARCHCCSKEKQHQKAEGLISPHFAPDRCYAQENKGKSATSLARKAAIGLNAKLLSRGIYRQCDPDSYVNERTPIWFSCDCPEGGHAQKPKDVLKGCRPCQSSRRQRMANGGNVDGSISRMGGLLTGHITGTANDAPWRVLTGQQERRNDPTSIYLFQTVLAAVRNFGIAIDVDARAKGHHPDNVVALLSKRQYPDRDTPVLIESAFKYRCACPEVPPGLEGRGNTTEYTLLTAEEFWSVIDELEDCLAELGPVEFVRDYCHPWQYQKAFEIGVLPQYLEVAE